MPNTNITSERRRSEANKVDVFVMRECVISKKEMQEMRLTDDCKILVSKDFKSEGGPLQPRLIGQISYTVDFETGDCKYKQINA